MSEIKYIEIMMPGTQGPPGEPGPVGPPADPAGPGVTEAPPTTNLLGQAQLAYLDLPRVTGGDAEVVTLASGRKALKVSATSGVARVEWDAPVAAIRSGTLSAGVRVASSTANGQNLAIIVRQEAFRFGSAVQSDSVLLLSPGEGTTVPVTRAVTVPLAAGARNINLRVQRTVGDGGPVEFILEYPFIADGEVETFVPATPLIGEGEIARESAHIDAIQWPVNSRNLVDLANFQLGVALNTSSGEPEPAVADSAVSPFLPCTPGETLHASRANGGPTRWCFYDAHRGHLGGSQLTASVTIPSQARFFRVSGTNFGWLMVNTGAAPLPHEPYERALRHEAEVHVGRNLFNEKDVYADHTFNTAGELVATPGGIATRQFVPVTQGQVLHTTYNVAAVFYDGGHRVVERRVISNSLSGAVEVPAGAQFARFSSSNADNIERGIQVFDVAKRPIGFEPFTRYAHPPPTYPSAPFLVAVPDDMYRAGDTLPFSDPEWAPNGNGGFDPQVLYDRWDALINANSDFITKQVLGQDQSETFDIWQLTIKSGGIPDSSYAIENLSKPKLLISANIHGSEETCAWVTYLFVRDMCERWQTDKHLRWLRDSVEFIVIPTLNPWGLENNTRQNSRGVDLNRNWPTYWGADMDPGSPSYNGPAPLSEAEAVLLDGVMAAHVDAFAYFDFHDFGIQGERAFWAALPAGRDNSSLLSLAAIQTARDATALALAEYGADPSHALARVDAGWRSTSNRHAARIHGLDSMTVEVGQRPSYLAGDPEGAVRLATDVFGNAVLNAARVFARYANPG